MNYSFEYTWISIHTYYIYLKTKTNNYDFKIYDLYNIHVVLYFIIKYVFVHILIFRHNNQPTYFLKNIPNIM